jgi:hypothetical protein
MGLFGRTSVSMNERWYRSPGSELTKSQFERIQRVLGGSAARTEDKTTRQFKYVTVHEVTNNTIVTEFKETPSEEPNVDIEEVTLSQPEVDDPIVAKYGEFALHASDILKDNPGIMAMLNARDSA